VPRLLGIALLAALAACERPLPVTKGVPPAAVAALDRWLLGAEVAVAAPGPAPAQDVRLRALGAEVYRLRCSPCHGVNGNGRGTQAARLSIPARDFTSGVFEIRSTPSGTLPTDLDLYRTISRGLHGTAMLPWSWLSELERRAVVEHVKSFSPRFAEEEPGVPVDVPPEPPETPELAQRGAAAYAAAGCPSCHGPLGAGDGPSARTLRRDGGRPIRPRPFSDRRFLRGGSLADLWLTLATGLDGTPMPSYETLPPDDLWAIAAHVRALAGPRTSPLPPDPEERRGYEIDVLGK